jgi:rhodanese-related sulfurtransferase
MSNSPTQALSVQQLRELVERNEELVIVDVRSPEEYAAGHVEGAVNIPANQLEARSEEWSRETTVVTVCNHGGPRSCGAAEKLREMGFEAAPLEGGTHGWLEAVKR